MLTRESIEVKSGCPVYLKVYHLSFTNYIFQLFGYGFYHSTIEIKDREYFFCYTEEDYTGIISLSKEQMRKLTLKERIYLGNTAYSDDAIRYVLYLLSNEWQGKTYDIFEKNCNDFSLKFAECLMRSNVDFPSYINRFASIAALFKNLYLPIQTMYMNYLFFSEAELLNNHNQLKTNKTFIMSYYETPLPQGSPTKLKYDFARMKRGMVGENQSNCFPTEQNLMMEEHVKDQDHIDIFADAVINNKEYNSFEEENKSYVNKDEGINFSESGISKHCSFSKEIETKKDASDRSLIDAIQLKSITPTISESDIHIQITNYFEFFSQLDEFNKFLIIFKLNKFSSLDLYFKKNITKDKEHRYLEFSNNTMKYLKIGNSFCFEEKDYDKALVSYTFVFSYIEEFVRCHQGSLDKHLNVNQFLSDEELCSQVSFEEAIITYFKCILHLILFCYQNLKNYERVKYYSEILIKIDEFDITGLCKHAVCLFLEKHQLSPSKNYLIKAFNLSNEEEQKKLIQNIIKSIE